MIERPRPLAPLPVRAGDHRARQHRLVAQDARRAVLYDIDSRIPNLALMKLSTHYRSVGWEVHLNVVRSGSSLRTAVPGDLHVASTVFHTATSLDRVAKLRSRLGPDLVVGGSGIDLAARLPPEVESCFPDYDLYGHRAYALGFLTRGCPRRCAFCIVPRKEGTTKREAGSFDTFVPPWQRNVMLLDDNLLAYDGVHDLLREMAARRLAVNFSQTLDITLLTEETFERLRRVDSRNSRFDKKMIYFSLNHPAVVRRFVDRRPMLRAFGEDGVSVVALYGFDTSLRQDYERFYWLRRLRLIPFFQEYWPIPGVPARLPHPYFDDDLDRMIRLTFRSNGQNWEKYLRWLNRLYFHTFGKYYRPLVEVIHRDNHKEHIRYYLERPHLLTDELYRSFREPGLPCGRPLDEKSTSSQAASTP